MAYLRLGQDRVAAMVSSIEIPASRVGAETTEAHMASLFSRYGESVFIPSSVLISRASALKLATLLKTIHSLHPQFARSYLRIHFTAIMSVPTAIRRNCSVCGKEETLDTCPDCKGHP